MGKEWRVFDLDSAKSFSELFLSPADKQRINAAVYRAGGSRFGGLAAVVHWEGWRKLHSPSLAVESLLRPIYEETWGKTSLWGPRWCLWCPV